MIIEVKPLKKNSFLKSKESESSKTPLLKIESAPVHKKNSSTTIELWESDKTIEKRNINNIYPLDRKRYSTQVEGNKLVNDTRCQVFKSLGSKQSSLASKQQENNKVLSFP